MAVDDIRIKATFKGHRKRNRLRRIIGPGSDTYLIDFWISVATSRPTGELTGWDSYEIADAAGYPGDPDEFYNALVDCKFVDVGSNGALSVHNWSKRQGYVATSERRSIQAKMAAAKRWGNTSLFKQLHQELYGKQTVDANSNAGSNQTAMPHIHYHNQKTKDQHKMCDVCQTKHVDQPHHAKCRSCFGSQYAKHDQPTGRHSTYPKCPYCKREQSGLTINHQSMNCNICEDET